MLLVGVHRQGLVHIQCHVSIDMLSVLVALLALRRVMIG